MPLSDLVEEIKKKVFAETLQWRFALDLATSVGYGEVIIKIHDHQIRDVELLLKGRPDKPA